MVEQTQEPSIPEHKKKDVWKSLKKEITASNLAQSNNINFYNVRKWVEFQVQEGKLERIKKGVYTYYKLKEQKK